jgi:hypothetical protein
VRTGVGLTVGVGDAAGVGDAVGAGVALAVGSSVAELVAVGDTVGVEDAGRLTDGIGVGVDGAAAQPASVRMSTSSPAVIARAIGCLLPTPGASLARGITRECRTAPKRGRDGGSYSAPGSIGLAEARSEG